ncbi:MAG TPA: hypothetical protein VHU83_14315 [Bryobacteraceae bacterium]|nr:hypothetical protein [Bryobacteraceae bacterium]
MPKPKIRYGVGMNDDGPSPPHLNCGLQPIPKSRFVTRFESAWSMDGDVIKRAKVERIEGVQ